MERHLGYFAILTIIAVCVISCTTPPVVPTAEPTIDEVPTLAPTAVPVVLVNEFPTFTPIPTLLPTNTPAATVTNTPTSTSTATNMPTDTPEPTSTFTPQPISTNCADAPNAAPEYRRYWLGERVWPKPAETITPHLWMDKPLPGGGRYLINPTFPYEIGRAHV